MAGEGCQRALGQYADRADGALAIVDDLRAVGLGNPGRRPRAGLCEALRVGDRAQRPHSPNYPEGRRKCHLPYRGFDGISAARAGHRSRSWSDEGVPANELRKYLGIRTVNYVRSKSAPALIDS